MKLGPPLAARLAVILGAVAAVGARAHAQTGDVDVSLNRFGVGSVYRPGEIVAVRLDLSVAPGGNVDPGAPVWVHIEVPNADGDVAECGRSVALTPDLARPVWLYLPLPPDDVASLTFPVRVFEFADGRRGRELAATRIRPTGQAAEPNMALIAVIGQRWLGLDQYAWPMSPDGPVPSALENTRVIAGISPRELCDRWEGLREFEAIAWGDASPLELAEGAAEALREWVRRGGHLVLTLPEDGNPWGLGEEARTPLADLFPSRAPRVVEDVPLSKLLPILGKARGLIDGDFPVALRVFDDVTDEETDLDNGWEPLIVTPEGQVIVVQRTFGHGRLTLVGLDLARSDLAVKPQFKNGLRGALPDADVFWNRILGRRADTPSTSSIGKIDEAERLSNHPLIELPLGNGALFREPINMSGEAGKGLLLALAIFAIYWLVAGPVGHYLLRAKGWVRHSWVAFAAAAAIFTGVAWAGATWLRRNDVMVDHITVLDHIARPGGAGPDNDPQLQRAASWFSVYLPGYGDAEIGLRSEQGEGLRFPPQRDLLWSWTPPNMLVQLFPNVDRYVVDVNRDVDDYRIPRRSTATQLYAHWLGALDSKWGGTFLEDENDPVRVEINGREESLHGTIVSELPRVLEHVKVIWVKSNRVSPPRYQMGQGDVELPWVLEATSGSLLNSGEMWGVDPLQPGASLSFAGRPGGASLLDTNLYRTYIKDREEERLGVPGSRFGPDETRDRIEMLSLFRQLRPPRYLREPGQPPPPRLVADRLLAREIDLSQWLNRPCVIVMGWIEAADLPIPLLVDGRPVEESAGTVFFRWVRPLPLEPAVAFDLPDSSDSSDIETKPDVGAEGQ